MYTRPKKSYMHKIIQVCRLHDSGFARSFAAFATLSYLPEGGLLDEIARHAVTIIGTFRPQATSNTLWAFAKLGYCPSRALLEAGAGQMLLDLSKSVPQVRNTHLMSNAGTQRLRHCWS